MNQIAPKTVSIDFSGLTLTGELEHDDQHRTLQLITDEGPETLSVNLDVYGLVAPSGHVWVRNYSEHTGLPGQLCKAGIAETVETTVIGPFNSSVALMRLAGEEGLGHDDLAALAALSGSDEDGDQTATV